MSAPSSARPNAMALPIPRPPPVTRATRPSCDIDVLLFVFDLRRSLLRERAHCFRQVASEARQHLRAVLEVDARLERTNLELTPHHLFGHAYTERTVADDQ